MIDRLAFQNLLVALAGVAVVLCLFLPLVPAILVILTVAMVDLNVVGLMYWWNVPINVLSLINLVMVVGFAVDYSAHVTEAYCKEEGTEAERVQQAMEKVGMSVFHGGISTFLAVSILAFTTARAFQILFKMFWGLVATPSEKLEV